MRRQIKQTADFCRWSIYLTVIIAALCLVVARLLVNQLYLYEENIESWLSSAVLTQVETDAARGEWLGLFPVVQLEGLTVGNPGQSAASAQFVRAEPNYLQSFQHGNAIWEDLRVTDLRLDLVQMADGSWTLRGLTGEAGAGGAAFSQLLEMFFRSRLIRIDGLQANFNFRNGRSLIMNFGELVAENDAGFHRLRLQAEIQGAANRLTYLAELEGDASQPDRMRGVGYMTLAGADIGGIVDVLAGDLLNIDTSGPMPASGALWFDFSDQGSVRAEGNISVRGFALGGSDPLDLNSALVISSPAPGSWQLRLEQAELQAAQQQLQIGQLSLGQQGNQMQVTAANFDLTELASLINENRMLPGSGSTELAQLQPAGQVEALQLDIPMANRDSWRLSANLSQLDLNSWKRAPAVENLSGHLEMTADVGRFQIDGENTLVAFEELFSQPLLHEELKGQVNWRIDWRNSSLLLYSGKIDSRGAYGITASQFRLVTPLDGSFASDFTLMAGTEGGRLQDWPAYVPLVADPQLLEWLQQSGMEGQMPQTAFVYRGKLRENLSQQRHIELLANVEGAALDFAEGWPRADSLQGRFMLADGSARFEGDSGFFAGLELGDLLVDIRDEFLRVQSQSWGDLSNYQAIVVDSPLSDDLSTALDPLSLAGPARANFELEMPLDDVEEADASMLLSLQGNQLLAPQLDLAIENIRGDLLYDASGLRSENLAGELWGRELEAAISQQGDRIDLELQGSMDVDSLHDWPALDLPPGLSGRFDLQGLFSFAPQPSLNSYRFLSDSVGLALDIPGELAKTAEQSRALEVILVEAVAGLAVELSWGEQLQAALDLDSEGQVSQAAFSLNAPRPSKIPGQVQGRLIVDQLDVDQWMEYLSLSEENSMSVGAGLQPNIVIRSYSTHFSGLNLGPVQANLARGDAGHQVSFQTAFGGGRVDLHNPGAGFPVNFEWLDLKTLPQPSAGDQAGSGMELYDPSQLIGLQLSVAEMYFGDRPLGQWSFQLEPLPQGAQLNRIQASFVGGSIDAQEDNHLTWVLDEAGGHSSQLQLRTEIANVADLFEMFDQPRAMTSQGGELQLDMNWSGAPWQAELEQTNGLAQLNLRQGNFNAEMQGVNSGMMKLVGLVNIQNWGRRLQFDFSDLTGDGTAYDSLSADVQLAGGSVVTNKPVDINLATGRLRLDGEFDLIANQVEGHLVANLPVRDNLTWITGVVAGLPAAAGVWLFGELFKDELESFARVTYRVSGSLEAPQIEAQAAEDI